LVGPVARQPAASVRLEDAREHPPTIPAGAKGPLPQPVPPPQRSGGLRWGAAPSDQGSAIRPTAGDVKRRVAELAAQVDATGASRPASRPQAAFGELDLDFDEGPAA